ncbi:MAG: site-specific integrase [Streptomyces sp.]|jgi:integrase|nr:site-specific integrase [Streptomyces sp.]
MPNITARQAAERWGVSESMARRILSDVPAIDRDIDTGAKLYNPADADAARQARPGRGVRSDLTASVIPDEEYERLVADDSIPAAHRALWALLHSGLRVSEALSLDVRDVDLANHTVRVDYRKLATDPRSVQLGDRTVGLLREVVASRGAGPLITEDGERPVTRESATRFARAAAGASIHGFRPRP